MFGSLKNGFDYFINSNSSPKKLKLSQLLLREIEATTHKGARKSHVALRLPTFPAIRQVSQQCKLITSNDLRNNQNQFSGVMILLSGDFHKILPVVRRSTQADKLNAYLMISNLWKHVKVLYLSKKVRAMLHWQISYRCSDWLHHLT